MREDLAEEDIPHRTKIRTAIINTWKAWFIRFKDDLAVRRTLSTKYLQLIPDKIGTVSSGLPETNHSPSTSGLHQIVHRTYALLYTT
jgi:hypothetical protein